MPQLADVGTVAFDLVEGEVLVRQAIAIETDVDDTASFDIELVDESTSL